jgi:hypothetical protein
MLLPLDKVPYAKQVKYRQQKELVTDQVLKINQGSIVVSNEVQIRLIQYYNGFREDQNHRFISYDEYEPENSVNRQELLLLNWYTRYLSGMDQNDLPFWARNIPMDIEPLFKSEDPELTIFHIADLPLINTSWIPLLSSFNDFEGDIPFWRQKKNDFTKDITYAGKTSNRVSGFSSSFEYPLDSLQIELRHDLRVHCSLYCYAESITNAKLVVSIENSSGTGFWQALEMNRYIKAYSNWWPLKFDVAIPQKDLVPESVLKVYVWKNDNSIVYIDNFKVHLCEFSR